MPKGQVFSLADGQSVLRTATTRNEVPDAYILNPNDGVIYVKLNSGAALTDYDYKIPSQSFAGLPGPWVSIGFYYVDQGGARAPGEISLYEGVADRRAVIPYFNAIGRAVPVGAASAMDIQQGNIPSNPPGGFTRLWSDISGKVYRLLTGGDNKELAQLGNDGKLPVENLPMIPAGNLPPMPYVNETGDTMTGALNVDSTISASGSLSGNGWQGDAPALYANGRLGAVDSNDFNTGHVSIQSQDGQPARIGFHTHGVIGHSLYQRNDHTRPFNVISNAAYITELITDIGQQTLTNKRMVFTYYVEPYNNYQCPAWSAFYIINQPGWAIYLPAYGSGAAGEILFIKNWSGGDTYVNAPGGCVIGQIGGTTTSFRLRHGEAITILYDGGAGMMIV